MRMWWCLAGVVMLAVSFGVGEAQSAAFPGRAAAPAQNAGAGAAHADGALERPVTLDVSNVELGTALRAIVRQARLELAFSDRVVPVKRRVSITAKQMPAGDALKVVLEGTGLVVRESASGQLTLVKEEEGEGKEKSRASLDPPHGNVWGIVVDSATTAPLEGVVVSVKGTKLTTTSN